MTTEHVPKSTAILLLSCPDQKGVVATIADFVYRHNGNILHADEHADEGSNLFLMRVEFDPADFDIDLADFGRHFVDALVHLFFCEQNTLDAGGIRHRATAFKPCLNTRSWKSF